jgi:hypothetical protein
MCAIKADLARLTVLLEPQPGSEIRSERNLSGAPSVRKNARASSYLIGNSDRVQDQDRHT